MLDRASESIIGTGLDMQLKSNNVKWDDRAEKMFQRWWDMDADIRGMHTGFEIERLGYRASKVDGDVLFLKTSHNGGQIQAIEADRISTPTDLEYDPFIINGVKVNEYGRPTKYYVSPTSGNETYRSRIEADKYTVYDAKDCILLANRNRFSLTRGVPVFATNMQLFEDIDAFIETCIIHAKISASHVLFIERNGPLDDLDGYEETTDSYGNTRQEQTVSPGMILQGEPGEQAKGIGSTQSMVQFSPFVTQLLRFAGLNFGMPLEMLSLDFSKTNYSSARAALLVAHKSFVIEHKKLMKNFMEPIIRWKIDQWIKRGQLDAPKNGYRVGATPPTFMSIDPLKESLGEINRVQHSFATNRDVCAAKGQDWLDVLEQRTKEIEVAVKSSAKINQKAGEILVNWRDLLGDAKNFDAGMYEDPGKEEEPAVTGDDE